ncbi:MAG: hypothetical protein ACLP8X_43295 [Streptosporangiaceae bacterium]
MAAIPKATGSRQSLQRAIRRPLSLRPGTSSIPAPGYIIAFGGIDIFVGSHIAQNVLGNPQIRGLTQNLTIAWRSR